MRFLILNTDYPEFLRRLYIQHPGLEQQPYEQQMRVRIESLFAVADFYSGNLRKLGHEAYDIHANNEFMQRAWAREAGLRGEEPAFTVPRWQVALEKARRVAGKSGLRSLRAMFRPLLRLTETQHRCFYDTLAAQIKYYKPDILLNQAMEIISSRFLRDMKAYTRILVGQHAATQLPESEEWGCYDLVLSSFPPTVQWFRGQGLSAELHRLGFEPRVLAHINVSEKTVPFSFVGSFERPHRSRVEVVERLVAKCGLQVWAPRTDHLRVDSPIRKAYMGQVWGREMYQVLVQSEITLNHHGDVAPYANNMRLFEATGVGTLLVTDWKSNLHEMFEPEKEVVAYRTVEECAEVIQYYLTHDDEREKIAHAGQKRTLRDHTYFQRMQELVDIVSHCL